MHHRSLLPSAARPLRLCTIRVEAVERVVLWSWNHGRFGSVLHCYTPKAKNECKPWSILQTKATQPDSTQRRNWTLEYHLSILWPQTFGVFFTTNSILCSHVTIFFVVSQSWQSRQSKPYRRRATRVWAPGVGTGLSLLNVEIGRDWTINILIYQWNDESWVPGMTFGPWIPVSFLILCLCSVVCLPRSLAIIHEDDDGITFRYRCMATLLTFWLIMGLLSTMLRWCSSKPWLCAKIKVQNAWKYEESLSRRRVASLCNGEALGTSCSTETNPVTVTLLGREKRSMLKNTLSQKNHVRKVKQLNKRTYLGIYYLQKLYIFESVHSYIRWWICFAGLESNP